MTIANGKNEITVRNELKKGLTYFFNIGDFGQAMISWRDRCRFGRAALTLTFSMVPRTRHTKGEQDMSLLLPPRPNRGKANLASRIRTIEKSPRRTRPFA